MAAALAVSAASTYVGAGQRLPTVYSPKSRLSFASWKQVRCDAEEGEAKGAEEGVKKTISMLDNLLVNDSQKKLGFGTPKPDATPESNAPLTEAEDDALDFGALFALDSPVLETLSGRLAMLGMASAFLAEKATSLTVFEQVFTRGFTGLVAFAGAVQLLTYASVKPIMKGESVDSRSLGPFTPRAERWNGRLAMVGFLLLILTEALRRAPLFH